MKTTLLFVLIISFKLNALSQSNQVDVNGDGDLNILIIGTSQSISDSSAEFSPHQISIELQNILTSDISTSLNINVVPEDIYRTETVLTGIANQFDLSHTYYCHSLAQYYFWPEDRAVRIDNLKGDNGTNWDYVLIAADPHLISTIPGFYSLGVNKIAYKVAEGGAVPLLLMPWTKDNADINHFEEFTYRTADGAQVPVENVPAGLAWDALPGNKIDVGTIHPTPNGAYVCAAAIYSHIFGQSASASQYTYDDEIADITHSTIISNTNLTHYSGEVTFDSPFKSCGLTDSALIYNHGGTSTENGILGGLQWVVAQDQ